MSRLLGASCRGRLLLTCAGQACHRSDMEGQMRIVSVLLSFTQVISAD
jgi:hypothetical protein